jgi:hypothetical protein
MKIGKFQLRGNNSKCAGAFQVLRRRAPAQLRGNIDSAYFMYSEVVGWYGTRHETSLFKRL